MPDPESAGERPDTVQRDVDGAPKHGGRQYEFRASGDRLEVEQLREDRQDSVSDIDPYDVLAHHSESGFKTPFERDEASTINPQPRPGKPGINEEPFAACATIPAATSDIVKSLHQHPYALSAPPTRKGIKDQGPIVESPADPRLARLGMTTAASLVRNVEGRTHKRKANMSTKSASEPDIVTLLSAQHKSILQLFVQVRDPDVQLKEGQEDHGQGGPQHYKLAHEIIGALMAHTEGVQRRLLPVIRENAADGAKLSDDSTRDDSEMLAIARQLDTMEVSAPGFITTVDALQRAFEHHVEREEAQLFPVLRTTLSPKNSRLLAAVFRRAEFDALSHSAAGETFAANVLSENQ